MTSNPIRIKIFLISRSVSVTGCRCPQFCVRPGKVMSTFSFASLAFKDSASKTSVLALIAVSKALFTSLTICPIFGLSSAGSAPIPRRISVIGPFLPKYLMRKSLSSSGVVTAPSSASACSLSACNSSLIFFLL